jgi:hypothetical protein
MKQITLLSLLLVCVSLSAQYGLHDPSIISSSTVFGVDIFEDEPEDRKFFFWYWPNIADTIPKLGYTPGRYSNSEVLMGRYLVEYKTDTVSFKVLCEEIQTFEGVLLGRTELKIRTAKQERELSSGNGMDITLPGQTGKPYTEDHFWRIDSTRWLENVEGCYHLIPVE